MGYSIAVDAMGGDHAPEAPVEGALTALGAFDDLTVTLLGDTAVIEKVLEGKEYNRDRLHILHTTQVVENEERSPADAIRRKKDSSMPVQRCWWDEFPAFCARRCPLRCRRARGQPSSWT